MAIITGGLHGRPAGNVAGVVYGAARTRTGKAVTARELVYPSNPQTALQMLQRHIFMESLASVRLIGPNCYQSDFNRAIGQLPGFHSMMSILLNNTNSSEEFEEPPTTPLGDLAVLDTLAVATGAGAAKTISVTWDDDLGINGTLADKMQIFGIKVEASGTYGRGSVFKADQGVRGDEAATPNMGFAGVDMIVGIYVKGEGTADGMISNCLYFPVTTHA